MCNMVLKHINLAIKSISELYKLEGMVEYLKDELKLDESDIIDTIIFLEEIGLVQTYTGIGINITDRGKTSSLYGIDQANFETHVGIYAAHFGKICNTVIGGQGDVVISAINQKIITSQIDLFVKHIEDLNLERDGAEEIAQILERMKEQVSTGSVEPTAIKVKAQRLFDLIRHAGNTDVAVNAMYNLGIIILSF